MKDEREQLTPEAREAVRDFILRMLTVPAIVVTAVSFALGFFINGAARNEAYTDAYKDASKEIRAITAEAATAKTEATSSRDRANAADKETAQLLETARKLKSDFETLTNPADLRRQLAEQLSKDLAFRTQLMAGIEPRLAEFQNLTTRVDALEKANNLPPLPTPAHLRAMELLRDVSSVQLPDLDGEDISTAVADPKNPTAIWLICGNKIVVVDDTNGDWRADKTNVFAAPPLTSNPKRIQIAQYGNRLSVFVTDPGPNNSVLTDSDGDGRADKSEKVP